MGETQNPIIFMISGFSDLSMTPKTNYLLFLETPRYFKEFQQIQSHVGKYSFCKYHIPDILFWEIVEKTRLMKFYGSFNTFLKTLNMGLMIPESTK